MIITSPAGLCNRIRVMMGMRYVCDKRGWPLTFQWRDTILCRGHEHAFTVPRIKFEDVHLAQDNVFNMPGKLTFTDVTQSYGYKTTPQDEQAAYLDIKWSPQVVADSLIGKACRMAVHFRGTDFHTDIGAKWNPEGYFRIIDQCASLGNVFPLLICTDDLATRLAFVQRYGIHEVQFLGELDASKTGKERQSSITQACSDLLACTYPGLFLGTAGSSFSNTIHTMRGDKPWLNYDPKTSLGVAATSVAEPAVVG